MTSFLKNLKSTLLDSNNKMPSRHQPNEDPFKRINSWDDGYEYIQGGDRRRSMGGNPGPMYSPPPAKPSRRATYNDRDHQRERHAYPSPPDSDDDEPRGYRRTARRSPSPPRRRESRREPERDRYRDHEEAPRSRRPNLDSQYAPRTKGKGSPRSRSYSRSPSPRAARRNDYGYDRHYDTRSPSPPRRSAPRPRDSGYYPDHHRDDYRESDRHHRSGPRSSGSSNSNDRKYPPRAGETQRPSISRSKSTSAKTGGLPGLSPQWKKAAQAALAAGSAAAFRARSQPGNWKGAKGAKVATAALGAAALEGFLNKNKDGKERDRDRDRSRERDRDRDRYDDDRDRHRERSRSRGGNGLGDFVGDFLMDQLKQRTSGRR